MAKKIADAGHHAIAVACDVSDEESVKAAVDTVLSQYKKIDILLNDAVLADKADALVRHVYNASKAAVVGLTKGMAASYAQYGITVNALGPGLFLSEMTQDTLLKHQEFLNTYSALCPASRPGGKGELNGPILFFSSDACSYTTGQFILVDGGFSLT